MDAELPVSLGFSARLNMLWDLSGAAPSQIEGRVISVLKLVPSIERSTVKPVSSLELSAQVRVSELLVGADTARLEGAAGGSPAALTVLIYN